MNPFAHLPTLRKARSAAAAAGLVLAAAAGWFLPHPAGAAPLVRLAFTPEAWQSVIEVQFGRASPLARARFKRRLGPGPKRPGKFAAPKKTTPPAPTCGVRGRPPCTTGTKTTGPVIVTRRRQAARDRLARRRARLPWRTRRLRARPSLRRRHQCAEVQPARRRADLGSSSRRLLMVEAGSAQAILRRCRASRKARAPTRGPRSTASRCSS